MRRLFVKMCGAFASVVCFNLSGCATVGTSPGTSVAKTAYQSASLPSSPPAGSSVSEWSAAVFVNDLAASAGNPDDPTKALKAFRTGKAYLDLQCSAYLDALGSANQAASNERKQVSIVGGLATALMGLTGSEAKEIAIAATTFSFAGASMDAFTNAILFSDAAKSVGKLVGDAQRAYLSSVAADLSSMDYSATVALLVGYERLCRPGEIRRLVDEAVNAATVVAESPGRLSSGSEVLLVLGQLVGALGQPVSETDAIVLYAWYSRLERRNDIKNQSALIQNLATTVGGDTKLADKLKLPFLTLGLKDHPLMLRWSAALDAVPGAIPVPPPVPAVAAASGSNGDKQAAAPTPAETTRRRALIFAPTVTVSPAGGQR